MGDEMNEKLNELPPAVAQRNKACYSQMTIYHVLNMNLKPQS